MRWCWRGGYGDGKVVREFVFAYVQVVEVLEFFEGEFFFIAVVRIVYFVKDISIARDTVVGYMTFK